MGIERALGIQGWMSPEELRYLSEQAAKHKRIAEVGSWRGRSTAAISDSTDGVVFAVDTWAGSPETDFDPEFTAGGPEWLFDEFMRSAASNVTAIRMTSLDAAEYFRNRGETFDMIFIDGAHDVESVKADIGAWLPLLAEGGLLCGHDYFTTVQEAVDSLLKARPARGSIWEMVGTSEAPSLLPCAILIPSLNRAGRLREVVANIHAATPEEHLLFFCVGDPDSLAILEDLGEWCLDDTDDPDKRYVTRMNKLVRVVRNQFPEAGTVFFGSDDVKHHKGWLSEALFWMNKGPAVVVVNDLHNSNGTQAVVRMDYLPYAVVDAPEDAFHHGYLHNFADTEMFLTARFQKQLGRAPDSFVEHLHPIHHSPNQIAWDSTYENAARGWSHDEDLFEQRAELIRQAFEE